LFGTSWFSGQNSFMPPRTPLERALSVRRQVNVCGIVQPRPGLRRVKGVMRVGKADPCSEKVPDFFNTPELFGVLQGVFEGAFWIAERRIHDVYETNLLT
ncbi:MAG: hypothetical protein ACPG40_09135, partial [Alphaproteobacteria bacterium]